MLHLFTLRCVVFSWLRIPGFTSLWEPVGIVSWIHILIWVFVRVISHGYGGLTRLLLNCFKCFLRLAMLFCQTKLAFCLISNMCVVFTQLSPINLLRLPRKSWSTWFRFWFLWNSFRFHILTHKSIVNAVQLIQTPIKVQHFKSYKLKQLLIMTQLFIQGVNVIKNIFLLLTRVLDVVLHWFQVHQHQFKVKLLWTLDLSLHFRQRSFIFLHLFYRMEPIYLLIHFNFV